MSDSEPDTDEYASAEEMDSLDISAPSSEANVSPSPGGAKAGDGDNSPQNPTASESSGSVGTAENTACADGATADSPEVCVEDVGETIESECVQSGKEEIAEIVTGEKDDAPDSVAIDSSTNQPDLAAGGDEPEVDSATPATDTQDEPVKDEPKTDTAAQAPAEPAKPEPTVQTQPAAPAAASGGGGWGSWSSWGMSLAASVIPQVPDATETTKEEVQAKGDEEAASVTASAASAAAGFFGMLGGVAPGPAGEATETKQGKSGSTPEVQQEGAPSAPTGAAAGDSVAAGAGPGLFDMFGGISGISAVIQERGEALVAGSLDTLELIGKKTVQVLTEDDPGFRSSRERIRSGRAKNPNLSQMLREAQEQTEVIKTQAEGSATTGAPAALTPREKGYNDFFEEYHGMIHLEALELLSRQSTSMASGMTAGAEPAVSRTARRYGDLFETTRKDADSLDDCDETTLFDKDQFMDAVQKSIDTFGVGLSLASVSKAAQECERRCQELEEGKMELAKIQESAIRALAQVTALSIEVFHKVAELSLLPDAESGGQDAEAFTNSKCEACFAFSQEICRQGEYLVNSFVKALNALELEDKDKISATVTALFIEASNSVGYTRDGCDFMLSTVQVVYLTRALA
ncbi:protein FAM114A2-like [Sycon ciliatum]|uniref:protein FAM114A2-like n=1 Tax=Sycon ciliatum TaxID=27933 RepID=UPI0031F5F6DB